MVLYTANYHGIYIEYWGHGLKGRTGGAADPPDRGISKRFICLFAEPRATRDTRAVDPETRSRAEQRQAERQHK